MRGRRPEADPHSTFHASRFDKLTVPSQVEGRLTFHGSWERAENDADGRASFAEIASHDRGRD